MWTLPELRDCLVDAGFAAPDVYMEGSDDEGDGNGEFDLSKEAEPCEGFIAYLVAKA